MSYPRIPRNFNYSLPDARARWIAEAYGLRFDDVFAELRRTEWALQGGLNYITDTMWRVSANHFALRFPKKLIDGQCPIDYHGQERMKWLMEHTLIESEKYFRNPP
jgi:hypothetical protein